MIKIHRATARHEPRSVTIRGKESDYTVEAATRGFIVRVDGEYLGKPLTIRACEILILKHYKGEL